VGVPGPPGGFVIGVGKNFPAYPLGKLHADTGRNKWFRLASMGFTRKPNMSCKNSFSNHQVVEVDAKLKFDWKEESSLNMSRPKRRPDPGCVREAIIQVIEV